jgi:cytochrome b561
MKISFKNTAEKFGLTARAFHWLIAVLILMLLMMGYQMGTLPMGPDKLWVIGLHKSLGITVLALGVMRLIWRILNAPPPALHSHAKWEKFLAKTIHVVFYISIIGMPLSGWIMSSASEYPVNFYGWFNIPSIVAKNHDLAEAMESVHELFALGLMGSVVLHIAGALKHRLIDNDDTLNRMGANIVIAALALCWMGLVGWVMISDNPDLNEDKKPVIAQAEADVHVSGDGNWAIVKEASAIEFTFTQYGQSVKSNFANWDGQIVFDKDNLAVSRADIRIDAASLKTGSDERN